MTVVIKACKRPLLTSTELVSCHPAFGPLPSPLDLGPVHASATLLLLTDRRGVPVVLADVVLMGPTLPPAATCLPESRWVSTIRSFGSACVQWE
jgi:hypothetical protein